MPSTTWSAFSSSTGWQFWYETLWGTLHTNLSTWGGMSTNFWVPSSGQPNPLTWMSWATYLWGTLNTDEEMWTNMQGTSQYLMNPPAAVTTWTNVLT